MLEKTLRTLDLQRKVIVLFQKDLSCTEPQTIEVPEIFTLLDKLYQESITEITSLESFNNDCILVDDKTPNSII